MTYSFEPFRQTSSVFFHIPKAAGISVAEALYGSKAAGHIDVGHCREQLGSRDFASFFKFAFVRDPLARAISAFQFLKTGGFNEADAAWARENLAQYDTFDEFAAKGLGQCMDYWHFRPQFTFITDFATGRLVPDFIGRFETLNRDFRIIAKVVNPDATLGHLNKSTPAADCSARSRAIIQKVYRRDYRLFYPLPRSRVMRRIGNIVADRL